MERSQLAGLYGTSRHQYLEWMRREIVQNQRIDMLAREVLGFGIEPFHLHMMQTQIAHPNNLILVGRGFGKSTICTVTKAIWYMAAYPKVRMAIASKTISQANARLAEIKKILESGGENYLLFDLFGEFAHPDKWNANSIEILQRYDPKFKDSPGAKPTDATPTVICVGSDQSKAGFHIDVEFGDDMIDEKNSRTPTVRDAFGHWYKNTFTPMIDPRDPAIPFRGHRHRVGTRYHPDDQYGQWIEEARKQWKSGIPDDERMWIEVIPALDYRDTRHGDDAPMVGKGLAVFDGRGSQRSPWESRHSAKILGMRRREIGELAFAAQYLNDISSHGGEIFDFKDFVEVPEDEVKSLYGNMKFYIGVDLAIGESETADYFYIVVVGVLGRGENSKYFIVDEFYDTGVRFSKQTSKIRALHDKWNTTGAGVMAIGVESGGYQSAQLQNLEDRAADATTPEDKKAYAAIKKKLRKIKTGAGKGKVERAHLRSPLVEAHRVHLVVTTKRVNGDTVEYVIGWLVREHMVMLPSGDHDDGFDAFDFAIQASEFKVRRDRPGVGMGVV